MGLASKAYYFHRDVARVGGAGGVRVDLAFLWCFVHRHEARL